MSATPSVRKTRAGMMLETLAKELLSDDLTFALPPHAGEAAEAMRLAYALGALQTIPLVRGLSEALTACRTGGTSGLVVRCILSGIVEALTVLLLEEHRSSNISSTLRLHLLDRTRS